MGHRRARSLSIHLYCIDQSIHSNSDLNKSLFHSGAGHFSNCKYSAKPIGREESTVENYPEVPAQRVQPDILDR